MKEEMKKASPIVQCSLDVECPNCGYWFNLFENDDDNIYQGAIFNNRWDDLKGKDEHTCPNCRKEFEIESIIY